MGAISCVCMDWWIGEGLSLCMYRLVFWSACICMSEFVILQIITAQSGPINMFVSVCVCLCKGLCASVIMWFGGWKCVCFCMCVYDHLCVSVFRMLYCMCVRAFM